MTCGMSCVGLFLLTTDKSRPNANECNENAHENAQENAHVERYKSAQHRRTLRERTGERYENAQENATRTRKENATRTRKENRPPRPCFRGGLLTRMRSPELKDVLSEDV